MYPGAQVHVWSICKTYPMGIGSGTGHIWRGSSWNGNILSNASLTTIPKQKNPPKSARSPSFPSPSLYVWGDVVALPPHISGLTLRWFEMGNTVSSGGKYPLSHGNSSSKTNQKKYRWNWKVFSPFLQDQRISPSRAVHWKVESITNFVELHERCSGSSLFPREPKASTLHKCPAAPWHRLGVSTPQEC